MSASGLGLQLGDGFGTADPDSTPHVDNQLVNAFFGLQLTGEFGMFVIVLTALASPHVKRNITWYSFCFSWIMSCISYTFVFLIGQQHSPTFGACVTQAAGIYAAPTLTSFSTLAFAIDMLLGVRAASAQIPLKHNFWFHCLTLLIFPWVVWLVMFVGMLVYGIENSNLVQKGPNGTYCDLNSLSPSKISSLVVVFATILILLIQGYIGTRIFRNRKLLRDSRLFTMALRLMVFSLLGALGLGIGFAYVIFSEQGPAFDIITALLPVGGIIIFGSHMDLVNVWLFWRPPRSDSRENDEPRSPSITSVPTPHFENFSSSAT
ncbi:hypothetical protein B0H19DRAFT_292214 [Mycena capillaripes]|nr:hypothetical protein B0H19DRAFT_292214 [Mycena capillaripes]